MPSETDDYPPTTHAIAEGVGEICRDSFARRRRRCALRGPRRLPLRCDVRASALKTPGEFMFPGDERNWRSRVWHPSLRRAGLRSIRIHDARHTHASY